jgi:hypothetical protein
LAQSHGHSLSSSGHSFFLFWHLGFGSWAITPAFQFWARRRDSSFSHGQFRKQASSGLGPSRASSVPNLSFNSDPARAICFPLSSFVLIGFVCHPSAGGAG